MQTVKINGKDYIISVFDTESSIKNRVALEDQTLPKYLKTELVDFDTNTFLFTNLLEVLEKIKNVFELVKNMDQLKQEFDNLSSKDIILAWMFTQYGYQKNPLDTE